MQELKEKRTYNQKFFEREDGKRVMRSHVGHIHYDNKFGLGDGEKGMRSIDMTFQWSEERRGWFFEYHNFSPFLPEYADEWSDFTDNFQEKHQTISYKARCAHVKGRKVDLIKGITDIGGVVYDNAFGEGIDLIYCVTRTRLLKLVRIRDGYKPTEDVAYDFHVKFSDPEHMKVFRVYSEEDEYELDVTKPKQFDSARRTEIRNSLIESLERNTVLHEFRAWDSNENSEDQINEIISVDLMFDEEGIFLRKNITADFLNRSVGHVYTDTTTSYYSGTYDGAVLDRSTSGSSGSSSVWDNVHDSTIGEALQNGGTNTDIGHGHNGKYYIYRAQFPVDTSGIPDTDEISAATFHFYANSLTDFGGGTYNKLHIGLSNASPTGNLATGDFDDIGDDGGGAGTAMNTPQIGLNDGELLSGITTGAFNETDFNSGGLAYIDKTGYTNLSLRTGHDFTDTFPNSATSNRIAIATSESANDPYLEVTYAPAAAGQNSSFLAVM